MKNADLDLSSMIDQEALRRAIADLEAHLFVKKREVTEMRRKLKSLKQFLQEDEA